MCLLIPRFATGLRTAAVSAVLAAVPGVADAAVAAVDAAIAPLLLPTGV